MIGFSKVDNFSFKWYLMGDYTFCTINLVIHF